MAELRPCPACGHPNLVGQHYCGECKARFDAHGTLRSSAPPPARRATAPRVVREPADVPPASGRPCACQPDAAPRDLCPACQNLRFPPIATLRGTKWSPLQVGLLSILCDILLIPSILALVRGASELREVARRERAGFYRPEHTEVRTGAVWALVLGGVRPGLIVVVMIAGMADWGMHERVPLAQYRPGYDEVGEILGLLESGTPEQQSLAATHLRAVVDQVEPDDAARALAFVEARPPEDPVASAVVSELCLGMRVEVAQVLPLYERLDANAQRSTLDLVLRPETVEGIETMLTTLEQHPPDEAQVVPHEALMVLAQHADLYLPRLAAIDTDAARDATGSLADSLCADQVPDPVELVTLAPVLVDRYRRAVADLEAASTPTLEVERSVAAGRAIRALGCVERRAEGASDVASILVAATHSSDRRVANGAVEAMLRRGDPVPSSTIVRLAQADETRWALYRSLLRAGGVDRIPAPLRSSTALAAALARRHAWGPVEHVSVERRSFGEREMDVHIFLTRMEGEPVAYAACGPFEDGHGEQAQAIWRSDISLLDEPAQRALVDQVVAVWASDERRLP